VLAATASTASSNGCATFGGGIGVTGDINWGGAAFTDYTATATSTGGAFTTVSSALRYKQFGKKVTIEGSITCTTIGTAAGSVDVTLPVNVRGGTVGVGTAVNTSTLVQVYVMAGINTAGSMRLIKYDGTFPFSGSGQTIWLSVEYEAP
jgi:hypothetical protein